MLIAPDLALYVQLAGFGLFLWLAFYLLSRTTGYSPTIIVAELGLLAQASFFASNVANYSLTDLGLLVALERWTWWSAVVPAVCWFHFSSLIAAQVRRPGGRPVRRVFTPVSATAYTAAVFIAVLGMSTDLFSRYSQPYSASTGFGFVPPGPAYPVYILYLVLMAGGALVNIGRAVQLLRRRRAAADLPLIGQLQVLIGGALVFLVGALWISLRVYLQLNIEVNYGYFCLFGGLSALAYGVAHYGLLLEGKNIQRDFVYSLSGVALVNLLYLGLVSTAGGLTSVGLLAQIGVVTLTHTGFDFGRKVFDQLFFSAAERDARAEARDYATVLGTAPISQPLQVEEDPASQASLDQSEQPAVQERQFESVPKEFRDQVRRALTGIKSPPRLAQSQLLGLEQIAQRVLQMGLEDNRLNRVAALRDLLIEHIEALRPGDGSSAPTGEAWRFYNVLYYPYVRELSRKGALAELRRLGEERRRSGQRDPSGFEQVLSWLVDVDEDTFYKWQRRASDTIADLLWEQNLKLKHDQQQPWELEIARGR